MADNVSSQSASTQAWPLPNSYFKISFTNVGEMYCTEVSGLEMKYDTIGYSVENSPVYTKMPGLRKAGNVTFKKCIFKDDKEIWDWINKAKLNTIQRKSVTVSLLDESGSPVKTWEIVNAWPKKIIVEDFKSDGNTAAVETMILAHEGVNVL